MSMLNDRQQLAQRLAKQALECARERQSGRTKSERVRRWEMCSQDSFLFTLGQNSVERFIADTAAEIAEWTDQPIEELTS